jgi:predicted PurR-regulated permease PerM
LWVEEGTSYKRCHTSTILGNIRNAGVLTVPYLTIASLVVAVVAVIVAVKQTNIANAVKQKQVEDQQEIRDWQLKHEAIAVQLAKINNTMQARKPGENYNISSTAVRSRRE